MNKGFIHVLESILVSLILIVSVPFLLSSGQRDNGWENAKLKYTGEDLLASLDRTGLDSNGESDLQDIMEKSVAEIDDDVGSMVGTRRIGFSMESIGSLKNEIRVGCNCTAAERSELERRLGVVRVNERHITFRVFPFVYDCNNPRISCLDRVDFDVILIDGADDLRLLEFFYGASQSNKNIIRNHLGKGHGIVEFVDLTGDDLGNAVQADIFGLTGGGPTLGSDAVFVNKDDPLSSNYHTAKYFPGVGMMLNFTDGFEQPIIIRGDPGSPVPRKVRLDEFSPQIDIDLNSNGAYEPNEMGFSAGSNFTITAAGVAHEYSMDEIDDARLLAQFNMRNGTDYVFHDFSNSPVNTVGDSVGRVVVSGTSPGNALVINATGPGRAAWLSSSNSDDVKGLLRATIIWAAGDGWDNVLRTTSSKQSSVSYAIAQGEEFYEPYIIDMTLWNLF